MDRKPLQTWVHPKGRLVLLGDACHPMLVRVCPLRARWHVLTDRLSLTALPCPRRRDRSRRRSGPRRVILARLVTRTSSGPSPSLPRPPVRCISAFPPPSSPSLTQPLLHSPNAQVTARVNNAGLLAAQPKNLPPAGRTRAARAGRSDAHRDGGRARRGGQADPDGREPEPVGGPDEEPDPVWLRRVRGGRAMVGNRRT